MKKSILLNIFLMFCVCLFVSCKSSEKNPPVSVSATENIHGRIINENNDPIEGIHVILYTDEALTNVYLDGLICEIYSDKDGNFSVTAASEYRKGLEKKDLYVQVMDPNGKYQETTSKVIIEYDRESAIGNGYVTIVMRMSK